MALEAATTSDRLLEREHELEAIRGALTHSTQGSGALLMIDGPAGVGKTALLDAANEGAGDADLLVLRARGAELERAFGLGIVRQLFDEVLRSGRFDPETLFTGAARLAAPLLARRAEGGSGGTSPDDPFAARHALYWLLANLAAQRPLAVLVDDAHWADGMSLNVLAHIANRLDGIPVALLVASRSEEYAASRSTSCAGRPRRTARCCTCRRSAPRPPPPSSARSRPPPTTRCAARPTLPPAATRSCSPSWRGPCSQAAPLGHRAEPRPRHARDRGPARAAAPPCRASWPAQPPCSGAARRCARRPNWPGSIGDAATVAADALIAGGILRSVHPLEFPHPLVGAAVYAGLGPAAASREPRARRTDARRRGRLAGARRGAAAALPARRRRLGVRAARRRRRAGVRAQRRRRRGDLPAARAGRARARGPAQRDPARPRLGARPRRPTSPPSGTCARRWPAISTSSSASGATMLLAGVLGQIGDAPEAADVLEQQFDALLDRPDLRGQTEAALANITRIDPATRHRAAGRDPADAPPRRRGRRARTGGVRHDRGGDEHGRRAGRAG